MLTQFKVSPWRDSSGSARVFEYHQYIGVFNFRSGYSQLIFGIKYTVVLLILVFYSSFSIIFGILEGLIRGFWNSTTYSQYEEKASREGKGKGESL